VFSQVTATASKAWHQNSNRSRSNVAFVQLCRSFRIKIHKRNKLSNL